MAITLPFRNTRQKNASQEWNSGWRYKLSSRLLRLSLAEASFRKRGFPVTDERRRDRLEEIGQVFITGYNLALASGSTHADRPLERLMCDLEEVPGVLHGFAYEGAAMGLCVSDALPWTPSRRFEALLAEAGNRHDYLLHVGAGWAMARLPWRRRRIFRSLDPLLAWLAVDGWGFHDVYFAPSRLGKGTAGRMSCHRRAYDQGAGRAVWFICGGNMETALALVSAQDESRHADLLSGLALAVTYTGLVDPAELQALKNHGEKASQRSAAAIAQGAGFAVEARSRAGNLITPSATACKALTGGTAPDAVVRIVRQQRPVPSDIAGLEAGTGDSAYEIWRSRVQSALTDQAASAVQQGASQ